MCQLCQQLGLDLHKLGAADVASANGDASSWAALPGGPAADAESPGSDSVAGSTGTSSTMSSGTSMRGYINTSGDQDWYAVTLTAGQTYTFALSGFGTGALSDAYLRLLNSAGTQITFDDDSGPLNNSKLTFTASTTATYYLSAQGFGSTTGQYLLTMATGTTPFAPVVTVGDIADYLTNTYWEVNGSVAHHWGVSSITFNVTGLSAARADLARAAFQLWSEVANLTFVETTGAAQIMLDDTQSGAFASSSYGGSGIITSASINVDPTWYGSSSAIDSYTLQTFIHEIGHALGLGHAGPYNGSATYGVDNTYANDTWQLTVMSYMDQLDYGGASYRFTMTPMMADILAIQNLYGAAATRSGDTVYGFGSTAGSMYNFATYSTAPALTIYDSGGTDTLNASGYSQNQVINLTGGSFSNIGGLVGNIGIYTTSVIENAIGGTGNDTITGNTADNNLDGRGGADTLDGGAGNDTLIGGTGNDTIITGIGDDIVVFSTGYGSDTVTDFTAGTGTVDRIDLRGMAGIAMLADVLSHATQVGAATVINFGAGDILTLQNVTMGNLAAGDFIFSGSPQPDLTASNLLLTGASISYRLNNIGTVAVAASIAGIYLSADSSITTADTLLTTVATPALGASSFDSEGTAFSLPSNLTPGTYYIGVLADYNAQVSEADDNNNGAAVPIILGNDSINSLAGTTGNDTMFAFAGNDTLSAAGGNDWIDGGAGADVMTGGAGNDIYFVDNAGDNVVENANEGTDTVNTTVDVALWANVENVVLIEGAGAISALGNSLDNTMTGNSSNNNFDGGAGNDTIIAGGGNDVLFGGIGADTMIGGTGDDRYYVDNVGDTVTELVNEGTDIVNSTVSYTLPSNVEWLILTEGAGAINATGNSLNNVLFGNSSDNILDGGAGADIMGGGAGNDIYYVDNVGDNVGEYANQGIDTVFATISYWLSGNVENITLVEGSAATDAAGNALNNIMVGNSNANLLYGGAGADTMSGRSGNDVYWVDNVGDTVIENANEGTDRISSTISYTLPANVEYLFLVEGSGAINATGNNLNNALIGNSSANVLDGGSGADVMGGRGGDDTYWVDNVGDWIGEYSNEGNDTVNSTISYTLPVNIENLTLVGTAAIDGAGNDLNNALMGNSNNNILDGRAGLDTLTGGLGNDIFVFSAGQGNGDTIVDFSGNGSGAGDQIWFVGYGTAAQGATFVQIDATHWQVNSYDNLTHDVITLSNAATIHPTDYMFF